MLRSPRSLPSLPTLPTGRPAALALLAAVLLTGLSLGGPLAAPASAQSLLGDVERATMELVADRTSYAPGDPALVAAEVEIEPHWHVNSNTPTFEWLIPTRFELDLPAGWPEPRIEYPEHVMGTFAFADTPLAVYQGRTVIVADLTIPESVAQDVVELTGTLHYQACDDRQCLPPTRTTATVTLPIGAPGEAAVDLARFVPSTSPTDGGPGEGSAGEAGEAGAGEAVAEAAVPAAGEGDRAGGPSLALMLLLGVLGGLILNAMPCVLPVLSLKVFSLVKSAGAGRSAVVVSSLATAFGILASFWALAGAAVIARAAGSAVGWGIQFQNPLFVVALLVIVVLFCLNLWGLFEIPLPQSLARAAGGGPREGLAGHLFSGFFATLMATPCSAPFLGTAVGFALSQSAWTTLAIFTAVGVGMASPYLALATFPGAARWLPKPGAWMDTLRRVMGFLLAGAAVWLLYVLAGQVGAERTAWVELGVLGLALFLWLRHRVAAGGGGVALARFALVGALAAVATVSLLAVSPALETPETRLGETVEARIPWQDFDQGRAVDLAAQGQPVFVDVTADWCFTCKVNERLVLETEPVAEAFERHGVVPMKADWTNRNDTIAAFLEEHGRYGIPFYVLYRPGREPHVFGELLSQEGVIEQLEALDG